MPKKDRTEVTLQRFIMDSALDEINTHCGDLLKAYQSCVSQNPSSWSATCLTQRRQLTACAEEQ